MHTNKALWISEATVRYMARCWTHWSFCDQRSEHLTVALQGRHCLHFIDRKIEALEWMDWTMKTAIVSSSLMLSPHRGGCVYLFIVPARKLKIIFRKTVTTNILSLVGDLFAPFVSLVLLLFHHLWFYCKRPEILYEKGKIIN